MKSKEQSKLKINFQLKSEKSPRKPVIANINFGYKEIDLLTRKHKYKPLLFPTGIKLTIEEWDLENKRPLNSEAFARMEEIRQTIEDVYSVLTRKKKDVGYQDFKSELEAAFNGGEEETKVISKVRLSDFIREHIVTSDALKKTSKTPYKNLAGKLDEYEKHIGRQVHSSDVDEPLFLDFMEFIRAQPEIERINAVWAIQKTFKATLKEIARKYKIKVFDPGNELSTRDKVQAETADTVYLNMEQIQTIIETEPREERLRNVKFIFMILLFTGCRESDVYKIKPESTHAANGEKFKYVRYIAQKTGTEILVPILKPLQRMFEKNGGEPPRKISQQKFNQWVKDLIMRCKMKDEVTTSYTDARGNKQFVTKKLYQFVSSHTGRRSFITNLINFIPLPTLTKITGHKLQDKSIIFAYNKMTLLENAVMFRKLVRRATQENPEYFPFELV